MHLWWLLRPYWEVVTCDHSLSVVCTQICPGPHWRTAYTSCKYKQKTVSDFHSIHCNANCCGIAVGYSVSKRASYLPTFSSCLKILFQLISPFVTNLWERTTVMNAGFFFVVCGTQTPLLKKFMHFCELGETLWNPFYDKFWIIHAFL